MKIIPFEGFAHTDWTGFEFDHLVVLSPVQETWEVTYLKRWYCVSKFEAAPAVFYAEEVYLLEKLVEAYQENKTDVTP